MGYGFASVVSTDPDPDPDGVRPGGAGVGDDGGAARGAHAGGGDGTREHPAGRGGGGAELPSLFEEIDRQAEAELRALGFTREDRALELLAALPCYIMRLRTSGASPALVTSVLGVDFDTVGKWLDLVGEWIARDASPSSPWCLDVFFSRGDGLRAFAKVPVPSAHTLLVLARFKRYLEAEGGAR